MAKKKAPVDVEVEPEPYVVIKAAQGATFNLPVSAAQHAKLIANQLKEENDNESSETKIIEVPQIQPHIMDLICQYCMERSDPELEGKPFLEFQPLKNLNCNESEEDRQLLLELLLASKYMGCDV